MLVNPWRISSVSAGTSTFESNQVQVIAIVVQLPMNPKSLQVLHEGTFVNCKSQQVFKFTSYRQMHRTKMMLKNVTPTPNCSLWIHVPLHHLPQSTPFAQIQVPSQRFYPHQDHRHTLTCLLRIGKWIWSTAVSFSWGQWNRKKV
jgi:hypothetical protein